MTMKTNPAIKECQHFLVDIDGTITDYREGATATDKLLHGNFLFPIIRDMMMEKGWKKDVAEQEIRKLADKVVFWDYPDFIAEFELSAKEAFHRMRQWHRDNLIIYHETVKLVKSLANEGKKLFIMSNNPYTGCMFKLQVAGLADNDFSSPYFCRIFGTNILRGCKGVPDVWQRAIAQIPAELSDICVIGDNPYEDGDIPRQCGINHSIIIPRKTIAPGALVLGTEQ